MYVYLCVCMCVGDKCVFKQLIFKFEITISVLNSGIHNILDRDITTTSGDASTEQHIFSSSRVTLAWLLPKTWTGMYLVAIYSLVAVHFLRSEKKELRRLFIMAKCKIASLGNVKVKQKSTWRFFSKLTNWRWPFRFRGFFEQQMSS